MAVAMPQTQAELDAYKANLAGGFGAAAGQVRQRDPAIQAAYDQIAAEIRSDAAGRAGRDASTERAQSAGMASAAQALGVAPVSLPNSRASRVSGALRDQYNGDADGWGTYLGGSARFARDRNSAQAAAFDESGRQAQSEIEREFQEYLASLSSGGGGGGGGGRGGGSGNYWEDEPLVEYGDPRQPDPGGQRGTAAAGRRLGLQGKAYQAAGLISGDGKRWLGPKPSAGNKKPAGKTRTRRGSGGTF
jgi:hypothetical protein